MKLLITGAGGFLGRHVVASAVEQGHQVRAMIRPASLDLGDLWSRERSIEVVRADLRAGGSFDDAVEGVDVVIHLAASKTGDLYEQLAGTVLATENLLAAMARNGVRNIVLTSSFSVYEYLRRWSWSRLDERSPLTINRFTRDEYCQTKLEQERIVREHITADGGRCVILRPGVIFGRDNLWTARLGMRFGAGWWIRTGSLARLPLTYVENCADAIVKAVAYDGHESELVLNVVDDHLPTQRAYMRAIRRFEKRRPHVVSVPWFIMRPLARLAWLTNRVCFGGAAKIPGLFVPSRLHARIKPLRYSNAKAKEKLRWRPIITWREGLERATRTEGHAASVDRCLPVDEGGALPEAVTV